MSDPNHGYPTYGAYLRSKNIQIDRNDRAASKAWDGELDLYRSAVAQGVEPATTRTPDIMDALKKSESAGVPFDATDGTYDGKYRIGKELIRKEEVFSA